MIKLKGALYVLIGAASFGVLATFVKKANLDHLDTSGLNFLQYFIGFVGLSLLAQFKKSHRNLRTDRGKSRGKQQLILFGVASGLTSYFYYLSIQFVPVSIGIILLMQAIWMGVVLEFFQTRKVEGLKVIGSLVILLGTLFAVDVFQQHKILNVQGVIYGVLASISYTITLYASNRIALNLPDLTRSKYLVLGALIIVILVWNTKLLDHLEFANINWWKYGLFLAVFGAIIPPIAFNKGFPITGMGLGSILTSVEIPVSILTAHLVLNEQVKAIQWFGVALILAAVALINYRNIKKRQ